MEIDPLLATPLFNIRAHVLVHVPRVMRVTVMVRDCLIDRLVVVRVPLERAAACFISADVPLGAWASCAPAIWSRSVNRLAHIVHSVI